MPKVISRPSLDLLAYQPGYFGKLAVKLYGLAASDPPAQAVVGFPDALAPYLRLLYGKQPFMLVRPDQAPPAFTVDPSDNRVLVGFSGGKDSTAVALMLRALGKSPILFRVDGINPAYPDEAGAAERVARALAMPLKVLTLRVAKGAHIENPAKNQVIQLLMADYGVQHGIARHAMGGLQDDTIGEQSYSAGYSDAVELFDAMGAALEKLVPGYKWLGGLLKNDTDALLTVMAYPDVHQAVQSCMTPIRYRGKLAAGNAAKFGIEVMPGRCMSCYECCLEWLHMRAMGKFGPNQDLVNHCIEVLHKAAPMIMGKELPMAEVIPKFIDQRMLKEAGSAL